ncbi:phage tail assembly chaperone [Rhizobiaceae bacterium BDR2-2]|uniref:Phage tail assembly chaperone n=1 Tax=Ectorhizobium quercum TaxID=2965071 RepID=A0AAE3N367_9HYPH|nr:rcc01693 family protein [Ectorhizobium quercum]MCX8998460.1 phage tail assembly chaperone [Ectorhizobium quercum]
MNAAAGAPKPFPWDEALHTGLCLLRLPPPVFWTMTPREFIAAAGGLRPRGLGPSRPAFEALMAAFPDR